MIEVDGLTKHYRTRVAVDDVTFTVHPGRVTGFLGPNGSGRTTTMRCVLGLTRPTSGTATVLGVPYRDLDVPMRRVGALVDPRTRHPGRTAHAHLTALAQSNRLPASRVDDVVDRRREVEQRGRGGGVAVVVGVGGAGHAGARRRVQRGVGDGGPRRRRTADAGPGRCR